MRAIIRTVLSLGMVWCMTAPSAQSQVTAVADSANGDVVATPERERAIVAPQPARRAGVTIRSVNDNRRRIYIIRPMVVAGGTEPVTGVAPQTSPTVDERPAVDGIDRGDLRAMEDRLRQYIDARAYQPPTIVQSPAPTTTVVPPPAATPPVVVAPTPVVDATPDTVAVAERPSQPVDITPPTTPTPQAPMPLPPSDVRFIERALLETGLFRTSNIIFEFDKDQLLTYSYATLDAVGDILRRHPEVKIMVIGHTDGVGSEQYNQTLSERRAETVLSYLTENFGLGDSRVVAIGKGESEPLAPNNNSTGRAINRRVEFIVVD